MIGNNNKNYNFEGAQDWHIYFKEIFKQTKINNFLEFGLGHGTEFLLDNCENVKSVEISLGEYNKYWYDLCLEKYSIYKNWSVSYIDAPEEIKKSNQDAQEKRYPLKDNKHIPILKNIVKPFLNENWDMIFVDAGFHNRGDLVNLCFQHAPIIAAHDTSRDENRILKNIYGYNIVNIPSNYEEYHFEDTYMGTTIWIRKDFEQNPWKIRK